MRFTSNLVANFTAICYSKLLDLFLANTYNVLYFQI